ncbi:MAG: hypothetical protein QNL04_05875 [SAR324 cluster bacterium]|nr:hypothetical protein [SAR324 cluster bacterium]
MKQKTIDTVNNSHRFLRENSILWKIPLGIIFLTGALIFHQLIWVFPPEVDEKDQSSQNLSNGKDANTKIMQSIAKELETPTKDFKPSFIVESKTGWQILNRFEVLDFPKQRRIIWIQNKNSFFAPLFATKPQKWSPFVKEKRVLTYNQFDSSKIDPSKISFSKARNKRFGLQLFSLPEKNTPEAMQLVEDLLEKGFLGYLQRSQNKNSVEGQKNQSYFYQIRVGFFDSEEDAVEAGEAIALLFPDHPLISKRLWVVLPSFGEISAELADFRIQRNKPVAISFSPVSTLDLALKQMITASPFTSFSYVTMQTLSNGKFQYRLKVGFFENRAAADSSLKDILDKNPRLFKGAQISRAKDFITAPKIINDQSTIARAPK